MPLVVLIADAGCATGKALQALLPDLDRKATVLVGNNADALRESPQLAEADVIVFAVFAGGNPAVIADIWPSCPKVRWIHSMSAGVDTLLPVLAPLPGAAEIPLTNAKGAFSRSLAEYSLCAMLHFNKQVSRLQANRASRTWDKFTMGELHGQTVGFIGFGDIAQATARLCNAFGMRIVALRNTRGRPGDELADAVHYSCDAPENSGKLEVFRTSDYVICSLPGTPGTYHACGAAEFAAMKPSGVFISIGRGSCVDEAALVQALRSDKLAGAALDVFEKEPLPPDSPVWGCEKLLLSPHNADLTETYMAMAWESFLEKFAAYESPNFSGFSSVVDKTKGY